MSVRLLTRTGNLLGYWSVIMTGKDFIDNQNLSTGIDLATSIGSVLFWEFGAACGIGTLLIEGAKNEVNQIQNNIMNNVCPTENVYNPTLGF
jgi:hypothetical protein